MPGEMFLILRSIDQMIGVDMHIPWPPGAPVPLTVPAPYATLSMMMGTGITSKFTTTIFVDGMVPAMCKGTDIGPLIPHIGPPSTTLIIEILTSGSKSYFGPSYYQLKDQTGSPGTPAVALLMSVNPNLNCGYPLPTPTGMVMAFTTKALGLTWGDILAGLINMGVDFAFQAVLQKLGGMMGEAAGGLAKAMVKDLSSSALQALGPLERLLGGPVLAALEKFAQVSEKVVATAVGQLVGTPLGTTSANFGLPGFYDQVSPALGTDTFGDRQGKAFDDYLNSPTVETVNQPTPGPAPPGEPNDGGLPPGGVPGGVDDAPDGGAPGDDPSSSASAPDADGGSSPDAGPSADAGTSDDVGSKK